MRVPNGNKFYGVEIISRRCGDNELSIWDITYSDCYDSDDLFGPFCIIHRGWRWTIVHASYSVLAAYMYQSNKTTALG
jgi:hypothetical protein